MLSRVCGRRSFFFLWYTIIKYNSFCVGQTESVRPHDFWKVQSAALHHTWTYQRLGDEISSLIDMFHMDMYLICWLDSESTAGFCELCHSLAPGPAASVQRKSTSPPTWKTGGGMFLDSGTSIVLTWNERSQKHIENVFNIAC